MKPVLHSILSSKRSPCFTHPSGAFHWHLRLYPSRLFSINGVDDHAASGFEACVLPSGVSALMCRSGRDARQVDECAGREDAVCCSFVYAVVLQNGRSCRCMIILHRVDCPSNVRPQEIPAAP